MLLDRRKVKFWQRWVFGAMAVLMAAFLIMIPVNRSVGCGGSSTSSATEQLDKDIVRYLAAAKATPKDPEAHRLLGESYGRRANLQQDTAAQQSDWRKAAAAYERAVALLAKEKGRDAKLERIDSLETLARFYQFLQDYQAATGVFGQLTGLRPNDSVYYFDMGRTAINAGDTNTALLAFTRFLELDPSSPDAPAVRDWVKANTSKTNAPSPAPTKGTGQ